MDYRLDEIDRRILHHLAADARNTTAPLVAEEVDVTPGTIRNRIEKLESHGILRGYHAAVDYERAEGLLRSLYVCEAPVGRRGQVARQALEVPGVVDVREVTGGPDNLHVVGVAADSEDISRIAERLADLGATVRDQKTVLREHHRPYDGYGDDDRTGAHAPREYLDLAGDAEIVEVRIGADSRVVGESLDDLDGEGLLDEEVLFVAIERDGEVLTPKGDTVFEEGDVANVLFRGGYDEEVLSAFGDQVADR